MGVGTACRVKSAGDAGIGGSVEDWGQGQAIHRGCGGLVR